MDLWRKPVRITKRNKEENRFGFLHEIRTKKKGLSLGRKVDPGDSFFWNDSEEGRQNYRLFADGAPGRGFCLRSAAGSRGEVRSTP